MKESSNKTGLILYRVSTEKQDFAIQKNKNREYCKQNGIDIVGEYTEFDISGYKTQLKDRVELLKVMARAEEDRDFDYLIVYNFDRIIRREDEAPFVLNHLSKFGIECIETTTGEKIKSADMSDKLMNYIRFWQAEYESVKTSQRVQDALRSKNQQNMYCGGIPAYGYKLYESDNFSNSGRRLKDLKIDEKTAWIVKDIFDMYINKGMGSLLIAEELNTNPLYAGKNRPVKRKGVITKPDFRQNTIIRMIQNPIYTGRQRYNTVKYSRDKVEYLSKEDWKLQAHRPDLQIIDDDTFQKAQEVLAKNNTQQNPKFPPTSKVTKSQVLCSGLAFCQCGSNLNSSYSRSWYPRKDGTYNDTLIYRYRCRSGVSTNKAHREKYGRTYYPAKKYDNLIRKRIIDYLRDIDIDRLKENINEHNNSGIVEIENTINSYKLEVKKCYGNISSFENKIDADIDNMDIYIKGIRRNEERLAELNKLIDELNTQLIDNKNKNYDYTAIYKNFKDLYNDFVEGDLTKQKLILGQIVEKIIFFSDGVEIVLKSAIQESMKSTQMDIPNDNNYVCDAHTTSRKWVGNTQNSIGVLLANFNESIAS